MVCIYCGSKTQVTNSRHQKRTNSNWRRRACLNCHAVFSTQEQADYEKSWLVASKNGKGTEPFIRDALFISLYKSCQHRPTALTDAIGLTDTVISRLLPKVIEHGTISRADIAEFAVAALANFDVAAATHYQAYHTDLLRNQ